jgi:hypothetical protein
VAEGRIAIDDIVEAATDGVLRALEARKISGAEFTKSSGFFVKIDLTAGGWPLPPIDIGGLRGGGLQAGGG